MNRRKRREGREEKADKRKNVRRKKTEGRKEKEEKRNDKREGR